MTDTDALEWLAQDLGTTVRPGEDRYGTKCWTWRVSEHMWAPAFSLRTAIAAAASNEGS